MLKPGFKFATQILMTVNSKNMAQAFCDAEGRLYYIMYDPRLLHRFSLDSSGIPYLDYGGAIGIQYTPVITALFALDAWNRSGGLKLCDEDNITKFLRLADWFLHRAEKHYNQYGWFYHFDWFYKGTPLTAPWISAMGNGMAISVLVRAWLLTKRKAYLEGCEQALNCFDYSISDGGVRVVDEHGCVWFEEYPVMPEPHVLNGFIFALFGLYDLSSVGNPKAKSLFLEGIRTLQKHLQDYDLGYWTSYDLLLRNPSGEALGHVYHPTDLKTHRSIALEQYHAIHVKQLKSLFLLTNVPLFDHFSNRWQSYYSFFSLCELTLHILTQRIRLLPHSSLWQNNAT